MAEEKSDKPDIEHIPGHTNILLIAPHGHDKDDKNTGKLVRLIAEQSGSYALINESYRKPDDDNPESKQNKRINLNELPQILLHLKNEFLTPLLDYKNKIVEQYGNALIFWIHGADDLRLEGDIPDNAGVNPKDVKVLVGWGQKTIKNRHTAEQKTKDILINALNGSELNAVLANPDKVVDVDAGIFSYCGWDKNNLNQMFRSGEYKDLKVQSFQLEFRMIGCRDNDEILKSTARNFINAISALIPSKENIPVEKTIEPTDKKNQRADKAQVPEKITDPEEIKDAIDVGGHGYDPLIEKAYQKLSNIFSKNYEQALMEAGQYIVRTFYAGEEAVEDLKYDENLVLDPAVIENARSNNSPRKTSLHQLCKKLNENSGSKAPSQAWIYNAVDLIVQWQDMKNKLKNDFYTYRNLLLSHKVCLLRIKDIEIKKAFIGQILEKELSVRKLKELITESKKQPNKEKSMYSVINEPDELFSEKYSEQFKLKELNKIRVDKLKKMQSKMLEQCKIFEVSRMNYADESYKCDRYVKKYLDVLTDFNTVIKFKENPSKDKKLKKSKTKMARP